MKSLSKLALCLLLAMSLTVSAFAAQVPDSLVAENLNGQQRLRRLSLYLGLYHKGGTPVSGKQNCNGNRHSQYRQK